MRSRSALAAAALPLLSHAQQQSCSSTLSADYPAPSVADGYVARLVANDLTSPRGIKFDSSGTLLVVEQDVGITAITFDDGDDGCITETNRKSVMRDDSLNHGIELSEDGETLYASSSDTVWRWDYSADNHETTSDSTTLVTNMDNSDHSTRTLLLSRQQPGTLIVSRGSAGNIDALASERSTGHAQIRAFDISNLTSSSDPYDFASSGTLLAWGVRNDVGVAEHPSTGGIYSVENSVDQMMRDGKDIHNTNPAEEMNFLGYLGADQQGSDNKGSNFGYPECYTAWDTSVIPSFDGEVGEQFAIGSSSNDTLCDGRQDPRLAFHPHMAPLDILFNAAGTNAWITFHGSWNSDPSVGYKLSVVEFGDDGEPVADSTSQTAAKDVVTNGDASQCASSTCFRPVGLAWDSRGRLFMSSDSTGEIYAIMRNDGSGINQADGGDDAEETQPSQGSGSGGSGSDGSSGTETGSGPAATETGGAGSGAGGFASMSALAIIFGAIAFVM